MMTPNALDAFINTSDGTAKSIAIELRLLRARHKEMKDRMLMINSQVVNSEYLIKKATGQDLTEMIREDLNRKVVQELIDKNLIAYTASSQHGEILQRARVFVFKPFPEVALRNLNETV